MSAVQPSQSFDNEASGYPDCEKQQSKARGSRFTTPEQTCTMQIMELGLLKYLLCSLPLGINREF